MNGDPALASGFAGPGDALEIAAGFEVKRMATEGPVFAACRANEASAYSEGAEQ